MSAAGGRNAARKRHRRGTEAITSHHTRTKHTASNKKEHRIKKANKEKHSWVGRGDVDGVPSFDTLPHPSIHQGRETER